MSDPEDGNNQMPPQAEEQEPLLDLGVEVYRRLAVDPGLVRSSSGFGLGESMARFAFDRMRLVTDIEPRWRTANADAPIGDIQRIWTRGPRRRVPVGGGATTGARDIRASALEQAIGHSVDAPNVSGRPAAPGVKESGDVGVDPGQRGDAFLPVGAEPARRVQRATLSNAEAGSVAQSDSGQWLRSLKNTEVPRGDISGGKRGEAVRSEDQSRALFQEQSHRVKSAELAKHSAPDPPHAGSPEQGSLSSTGLTSQPEERKGLSVKETRFPHPVERRGDAGRARVAEGSGEPGRESNQKFLQRPIVSRIARQNAELRRNMGSPSISGDRGEHGAPMPIQQSGPPAGTEVHRRQGADLADKARPAAQDGSRSGVSPADAVGPGIRRFADGQSGTGPGQAGKAGGSEPDLVAARRDSLRVPDTPPDGSGDSPEVYVEDSGAQAANAKEKSGEVPMQGRAAGMSTENTAFSGAPALAAPASAPPKIVMRKTAELGASQSAESRRSPESQAPNAKEKSGEVPMQGRAAGMSTENTAFSGAPVLAAPASAPPKIVMRKTAASQSAESPRSPESQAPAGYVDKSAGHATSRAEAAIPVAGRDDTAQNRTEQSQSRLPAGSLMHGGSTAAPGVTVTSHVSVQPPWLQTELTHVAKPVIQRFSAMSRGQRLADESVRQVAGKPILDARSGAQVNDTRRAAVAGPAAQYCAPAVESPTVVASNAPASAGAAVSMEYRRAAHAGGGAGEDRSDSQPSPNAGSHASGDVSAGLVPTGNAAPPNHKINHGRLGSDEHYTSSRGDGRRAAEPDGTAEPGMLASQLVFAGTPHISRGKAQAQRSAAGPLPSSEKRSGGVVTVPARVPTAPQSPAITIHRSPAAGPVNAASAFTGAHSMVGRPTYPAEPGGMRMPEGEVLAGGQLFDADAESTSSPAASGTFIQRSPLSQFAGSAMRSVASVAPSLAAQSGAGGESALNVHQLANQVYEMLLKRLSSERQRRGA